MISILKEEGKISKKLPEQQLVQFFEMWVTNHRALGNHKIKEKIISDVTILYATDDMPEQLVKKLGMKTQSHKKWQKYSSGEIEFIPTEGDHFSIMSNQEHLNLLGNSISRLI
jgi:hypothetical protein